MQGAGSFTCKTLGMGSNDTPPTIHHQETPKVTHERLRHNSISVIDEPEHIDHGTYRQSIN